MLVVLDGVEKLETHTELGFELKNVNGLLLYFKEVKVFLLQVMMYPIKNPVSNSPANEPLFDLLPKENKVFVDGFETCKYGCSGESNNGKNVVEFVCLDDLLADTFKLDEEFSESLLRVF